MPTIHGAPTVADTRAVARDDQPIATGVRLAGVARAASIDRYRIAVAAHDDDQADAHVERAEHLVVGDAAALCSSRTSAAPSTLRRSISAAQPSGRMRGRFSVIPPPVMCAMPLTSAALEQRAHDTADTIGAARAAPRRPSCPSSGTTCRASSRARRTTLAARANSRWCAGRPTAARSARRPARSSPSVDHAFAARRRRR